jgi:hypothetical protein
MGSESVRNTLLRAQAFRADDNRRRLDAEHMGQADHLLVVETGALACLDRSHASERYARHGVGDLTLAEAASFACLRVSTSEVRQLLRVLLVVVCDGAAVRGY